jgi:hypothetical protein
MRIFGTARPHLLQATAYGIYPAAATFGPSLRVRKHKTPFATLDFESKKLEAACDVYQPSLLAVERHSELIKNLYCPSQDMLRLNARPPRHAAPDHRLGRQVYLGRHRRDRILAAVNGKSSPPDAASGSSLAVCLASEAYGFKHLITASAGRWPAHQQR